MANYNLGEARGKIVLETDFGSLAEGQKAVENAKKGVEDSAAAQQQAWGKVGTAATVAGASVVAAFGVAVASASNFEFQLSAIQAVSGATAEEMKLISDAALRIGKDTSFSASEAAMAMEELVKAGISVEDTLGGAADATVALAAAGGVDLPTAATIAANAMNQFNLTAEDMVGVTDSIAGAANASAIDVTDLGMSMGQVGAVANLLGLSFDDTALAIAAMGNAGIKGSDAGTSLKTMLMNLQPTTDSAAQAMRELGLITEDGANQFFTAEGSIKSMAEISDVLSTALEGMTDAQKQATLTTLFGTDAVRGAAIVADTGAAGFDKLSESMHSVSAADVAATRLDNMKGSMEELMGSLETLMISVGTAFIPMVRDMVDAVTAAVNWFGALDAGTQQLYASIALVGGGLLLALGIFIKITQAMAATRAAILAITGATGLLTAATTAQGAAQGRSLAAMVATRVATVASTAAMIATRGAMVIATAAQWAWNAAMTANPIGIIITAIGALVAALIWFFTETELGREIWANFMTFLQEAWTNISAFLITLWEGLSAGVSAVWEGIMTAVGAVVDWFQTYVWPVIQFVIDAIVAYFQFYYNVVSAIWNYLQASISAVVGWFMTYVWPTIQAVINFLVALFQFFGDVVALVWNTIATFISEVVTNVVTFLTELWTQFASFWTDVWTNISSFVTDIWNAISAFISQVVTTITVWLATRWMEFLRGFMVIFNQIKSVVETVWNAIKSFIEPIVQGITNFIQSTWNSIIGIVSGIFNNVKNAIMGPIQQAMNFLAGLRDQIIGFFSGAGDWLYNAGKSIIEGFINGLQNMLGEVGNFFNDLTSWIPEIKGPPEKDKVLLTDNGKLIMQSLYNGLAAEMGAVEGLLNGMNTTIPMSIQSSLDQTMNLNAMRSSAAASADPANAVPSFVLNQTNVNPVAEPASIQTDKALATVGALSVIGTV